VRFSIKTLRFAIIKNLIEVGYLAAPSNNGALSMITLFTHGTPNGVKIAIALEEVGLPYKAELVEVFSGEGQKPEFLALSPAGKIPAIRDEDNGTVVYESNAILLYLAEKSGKLLPEDKARRSEVNQLLFLQASLQGPMFGQRMHFSFFAPETVGYAIRRYEEQGNTIDAVVERLLEGKRYFLGEEFSIVDITFFGWYSSAERAGFLPSDKPNLKGWYERVKARPAVQKAFAAAPVIPLPARKLAA
jgi:GST-like protein